MVQSASQLLPDPVAEESEEYDEGVHLTCNCRPPRETYLALCGAEVDGEDVCDSDDASDDCVMCAYVEDNNLPCPLPNCHYGKRRRFFIRRR
jgi:hypothetical protein